MILRVTFVLISYFLFAIIRKTHSVLQYHIWWRLNGLRKELAQARRSDSSIGNRRAHVLNIVWRFKIEPHSGAHVNDFLLRHSHFTSLEVILRNSVSLYAIDSEKATFIQTDEDIAVWKSQHGAFLTEAQYHHAKKIIIIYRDSYDAVVSVLNLKEEQPVKIVFIHNVPRSGGTLLLRTFECTNRCLTFCEPSIMDFLHLHWLSAESKESDWLVRAAIKMLCKPVQDMPNVDAYVIKARTCDAFHLTRILGSDNVRHVFIYRSVLASARSQYKFRYCSPFIYVRQKLMEISPSLSDNVTLFLVGYKRISTDNYIWQHIKHPLLYGIRYWMMLVAGFVTLRKNGFDIAGVLYDDLMADKKESVEEIFHYCALSKIYVNSAMNAFLIDSQENSRWSRETMKYLQAPPFTPSLITACNKISDILGICHVDENCRLEGVITGRGKLGM